MSTQSPSSHSPISSQPLVSIIICNYNFGHLIGQAIDSALKQTYRNCEIVVVDDASTDHSVEVIRSYGDQVRPIFLEKNSGQAEAFNTGLRNSRGEIVCFLDSDDRYYENKVERVVEAFGEHPEWVQVSHSWVTVDAEDTKIGYGAKSLVQGDVRRMLLTWGRYPCAITSALSYRRSVLDKILPIPNRQVWVCGRSYDGGADCYLVAVAPFHGQVGFVKEPLMYYRIHGKNRRSRSKNFEHAVHCYKAVGQFVNDAAKQTGVAGRFDISRDGQYLALLSLHEGASQCSLLKIVALTLDEARGTGMRPWDALKWMLRRSICVVSPKDGKEVLLLGLSSFIRTKLAAQVPGMARASSTRS
ncbi:glycosyltransferase [Gloeobacter violaceus]|uniref:Glr0456 protein n=1 Tax=Gloeobacter violaceus (strain ATCC 29082 / PCC 7421) TaxID=251221 RepID=Q7NNF5_GLOVI|nr:glycosyltransferase [Gloeobacter violaceus]BAC88397.1 glr0456 [Gloeobacter violaceus PCC 7421]